MVHGGKSVIFRKGIPVDVTPIGSLIESRYHPVVVDGAGKVNNGGREINGGKRPILQKEAMLHPFAVKVCTNDVPPVVNPFSEGRDRIWEIDWRKSRPVADVPVLAVRVAKYPGYLSVVTDCFHESGDHARQVDIGKFHVRERRRGDLWRDSVQEIGRGQGCRGRRESESIQRRGEVQTSRVQVVAHESRESQRGRGRGLAASEVDGRGYQDASLVRKTLGIE